MFILFPIMAFVAVALVVVVCMSYLGNRLRVASALKEDLAELKTSKEIPIQDSYVAMQWMQDGTKSKTPLKEKHKDECLCLSCLPDFFEVKTPNLTFPSSSEYRLPIPPESSALNKIEQNALSKRREKRRKNREKFCKKCGGRIFKSL